MSVNPSRDYFEIEAELRKRIEGDIHFDRYSRLLYSTDASIYQIEPIGVVVPRHKGHVQAGLVQDELNAHVRGMGLQFGPDTSTSNRATIGGMIGNNSAGAHSLTYGKTLDHAIELTVFLADGSEVVLKDLSAESMAAKSRADTLEGR